MKSAKGRRWTVDDEITALAVYKRRPRAHKFLPRIIMLPPWTLLRVASHVFMKPGFHLERWPQMKTTVSKIKKKGRVVSQVGRNVPEVAGDVQRINRSRWL